MTYLTVGGSDLTAFGSDPSRGAGFASSCRGGSRAHPHSRRINGRMAFLSFLSRNAPPGTIRRTRRIYQKRGLGVSPEHCGGAASREARARRPSHETRATTLLSQSSARV